VDVIFCAGGNRRFAEIALSEGMLYGLRGDYVAYWPPVMIDIPFEKFWRMNKQGELTGEPNWSLWKAQLEKVERMRPLMALAPDFISPGYRRLVVRMACQLVEAGIERVIVCPKFMGAIALIPDWLVIGISVPTSYAGFLPPINELRGRQVHLLGGAPKDQIDLVRYYAMHGIEVISVDCNMHQRAAQKGSFFSGRVWRYLGKGVLTTDEAFRRSCKNIMAGLAR
jgi:hypothetical protein